MVIAMCATILAYLLQSHFQADVEQSSMFSSSLYIILIFPLEVMFKGIVELVLTFRKQNDQGDSWL